MFSFMMCWPNWNKVMSHYNETVYIKVLCKVWYIYVKDDSTLTRNPSSEPSGGTACTYMQCCFCWLKPASWHWLYHWKRVLCPKPLRALSPLGRRPYTSGSPSVSGSQPGSSNLSTNRLLAQLVSSHYIPNPSNFNLFCWLFRYLIFRMPNHQFD
jgi:hypothetical protein